MSEPVELESRLAARRDHPMQPHEAHALADLQAKLFGRPREPVRIARYELTERIGSGGSGSVYRAFDPELERHVALKLLHAANSPGIEVSEARARLLREAQAMAKLSHPNLVPVFDVGTYELPGAREKGVFIVMELVAGVDLERWLSDPHPWHEVLGTFAAAGRGLMAAHAAGVVHRDFKPANVLVGDDGSVRVADFGLATRVSTQSAVDERDPARSSGSVSVDAPLTRTGGVLGTPLYMAPEVIAGKRGDATSDQFSFCVALHRGLYGTRPFAGEDLESIADAIARARFEPVPRSTRVPMRIHRALLRGLSADPAARWPDMGALLGALDFERHRARRRVVAGLIGFASAATGLVFLLGSPPEDPCREVDGAFVPVFDDERRTSLADRFHATELPFADAAFTTVESEIEKFGRRWSKQRMDACVQTHHAHLQTAEMLDRRMACFDDQLDAVSALLEAMEAITKDELARAPEIAGSLPNPDDCEPAKLLRDQAAAPEPAIADEVAATRAELRRIKVLEDFGRYAEGQERVPVALETALRLDHLPLVSEARLRAGTLAMASGEHDAALEHLTEGWLAGLSSGQDRFGVANAIQLVALTGLHRSEREQSETWGRQANALLRRSHETGIQEGHLLNNLGAVALTHGDPREALGLFERSLEIHRVELGAEDPELANVVNNMGNAHLELGEVDAATRRFHEAIELREAAWGKDHPKLLSPTANLCNVHLRRNEIADAKRWCDAAVSLAQRSLGETHPGLILPLGNAAAVALESGEVEEARRLFERALELARTRLGEASPTYATTLANLGSLDLEHGDRAKARERLERALGILETALGPDHPGLSHTLGTLARLELEEGLIERALELARRAVAVVEASRGAQHHSLANLVVVLGEALEANDDTSAARAAFERTLAIAGTLPGHDETTKRARDGLARTDQSRAQRMPAPSQ